MQAGVEAVQQPLPGRDSGMLEMLFRETFFRRWNTVLVGGGVEPLYQPADTECKFHRVIYRSDYFASALHEVSHWCIAGQRRRLLQDYGYWYEPDGRSGVQQAAFETVEAKPQALEWLFSVAAGHQFRISADNLAAVASASAAFKEAVVAEVQSLCSGNLPVRARLFAQALKECFAGGDYLDTRNYNVSLLR